MKLYSHRGNVCGEVPEKENTTAYINEALILGYDAEIDVWYKNGEYFLGHDRLGHHEKIPREFLEDSRLIVHAKDIDTFHILLKNKNIHCFYHENDDVVLTSQGKRLYHETVQVYNYKKDEIFVDLKGSKFALTCNGYGVISDYICNFIEFQNQKPYMFKLLVLDVDGVLTNGCKTYNYAHEVISKQFCDRDFTAIKRFKSAGIPVVLLTGCSFNQDMAKIRELPFYNAKKISNQLDKSVAAKKICEDFKVNLNEIAYVGDDYYDLSLLNLLAYSFCPSDSAQVVKDSVKYIIDRKGGEGVVEALYELVKNSLVQRFPYE